MVRMHKIAQSPYTGMLVCALFSGLHVAALFAATFPAGTVGWLFPLTFILPGVLTMILMPGAWRKWYRWVVLVFLCFAVAPDLLALVLFTGQAWALYRSWFLERTRPLKDIFRPRSATAPAQARVKTGPETVTEVLAAEKEDAAVTEVLAAEKEDAAGTGSPAAGSPSKTAARKAAKSADKTRRASVQAAKTATVKASE